MSSSSSSAIKMTIALLSDMRFCVLYRLCGRQDDDKCRAYPLSTLCGNRSVVARNNLAHNGQANPGPLVLSLPVQPLKNCKDTVQIFLIESDAIVFYTNCAELPFLGWVFACFAGNLGRDSHVWRNVGLVKLQRVPDQILKDLAHLERVGL